jgi:phosphomannomutase
MISVAGVRGVVGESLTPPVLARFAAAFGRLAPAGPIVIGRDARISGPMVLHAVKAGLMGAGRDVVDIGLATTPATQVAVERLRAGGGVILTASHNPSPWNALKFLSHRGEFLDAKTGQAVRERYEADRDLWVPYDRLGGERDEPGALDWHLEMVLGLPFIDLDPIRARGLQVVVDGCSSVGGVAVPALLERMGVRVVRLDCE